MINLERDIGKILATLEGMKESLERHFEEDREVARRVTNIEKRLSWYAGGLAAIALVWTALSDSVLKTLGFK